MGAPTFSQRKANRVLVTALKAEVAELRELLSIGIVERGMINAPEDAEIRELCERVGYGAVMDSAARQWRKKDPVGAHTTGHCVGTIKRALGMKIR